MGDGIEGELCESRSLEIVSEVSIEGDPDEGVLSGSLGGVTSKGGVSSNNERVGLVLVQSIECADTGVKGDSGLSLCRRRLGGSGTIGISSGWG